MNETLRQPPFSIDAEQAVLGALLADPESIERCSFLEGAHFYRHDHRIIFEEIARQFSLNRTPDPITVAERLGEKIEGGLQYLIQLRASEASGARVRTHADIVVEHAKRRQLLALSDELAAAVYGGAEVREIADTVVGKVEALVRSRLMQEPQRMSAMMDAYVQTLQDRQTGLIRPVSTGLEELDAILGGGLEVGTLTVIAGRPSMGKTALGLGLAAHASEDDTGLFLSMEMERQQVLDRRVSAMAAIPMPWLRRPDLDETQWTNLTRAIQMTEGLDLYIDDQTALNMMAIRAKARKVRRAAGRLRLLVVDQLSFITGSKLERRTEQVGEYTRGMVALGKELGCAVVLLCQLSRKCEERPNKRPILSDLADSGAIEQDAATIIFAYRDEVYHEDSPDKGTAELIVAKQRQGKIGTARVAYIGEQTKFANLHKGWVPAPKPDGARRSGRRDGFE